MSNASENNKKNKKNHALDFFTFQNCAFIISIVFLVIAISSAYPVYMEGKIAQESAQQILERFDKIGLKLEVPVSDTSNSEDILVTEELLDSQNEDINIDGAKKITYKQTGESKVEYKTIAKLYIEKIGLKAPVISEWSYELLDISVNKFSGPEPNELGNFVIIGHNYTKGTHFGRLHLLEIGDLINLTDLSGREVTYEVYEILTIKPDQIDKLTTYENRTLTLVTCDASSELRVVIKSKYNN